MPKRIDPYWIMKIAEEAEANPAAGPVRIERRLNEVAAREGRLDQPPSVRTVGRILVKHRNRSRRERAIYREFHWPQAMEARLVPWEATKTAIDLLRYVRLKHLPRPTVQRVLWHWRLSLVSPDWKIGQRDAYVSLILFNRESQRSIKVRDSVDHVTYADLVTLPEDLDWSLTFEPWKSETQAPFHQIEFGDGPIGNDDKQKEEGA